MREVVSRLFGDSGFVTPTAMANRFLLSFWDSDTGRWLQKQDRNFDGGWRWFRSDMGSFLTLYNVKLHNMAFTDITDEQLMDTTNPEFLLLCAQSRVLVDHNAFEIQFAVIEKIRADFRKLRQELGIPYAKQVRSR